MAAEVDEWWRGGVIYQIYPRSFADGNDDGVGDLRGITDRLDYVASLGVDGIWLSPIFTSPMRDHGYDVADYRSIDPLFGSNEDFVALIERAHELDLRVIIDQVYSHSSDQHPWFEESRQSRDNPKADWYVWADPKPDGSPPNNWQSVFGGIAWTWEPRRRQYYLHNFVPQQPDLNFHCAEVCDEILDTARFWLDRGVDGFRLDVVNFYFHDQALRDNPPLARDAAAGGSGSGPSQPYAYQQHLYDHSQPENLPFLERLRALLDGYAARMTVGEISGPFATSVDYTRGSTRLHTAYSFPLLTSSALSPELIKRVVGAWAGVDAWPSWSFSNHDVPRAATRFGVADDPRFARLLIALLTCLRGTVFLYQGEELGLPEAQVPEHLIQDPAALNSGDPKRTRDGCRTPMPWQTSTPNAGFSTVEPWLPVDARHIAMSVAAQEADPASVLCFTREFIAFRKDHAALRLGDLHFLAAPPGVLLMLRERADETLLCAFNLTSEVLTVPTRYLPGKSVPLAGMLDGELRNDGLRLGPYGGYIGDVGVAPRS